MTDAPNPAPAVTLDMRGTSCPAPLLGAKRIVDDLHPGDVLLLYSDCPGTPDDLFAWSRHTDNHVMRSERQPDGKRHSGADNCVTAVEASLSVKQMHRTAATAAATGRLAKHLCHYLIRRNAPREGVAMFAISRHNGILWA